MSFGMDSTNMIQAFSEAEVAFIQAPRRGAHFAAMVIADGKLSLHLMTADGLGSWSTRVASTATKG